MWASTIPAVMSALITLWQEADALAGVTVSDGVWVGDDSVTSVVCVGYDGNDGAVQAQESPAGFDADTNQEAYTVFCSASAVSGNNDPAGVRETAFGLYRACCEALRLDSTLGGLVLRAMPGELTVRQSADAQGWACTVQFGITVSAFTTD